MTTSPFVIRSIYRSLLRSSKPFSPPSPNYAVYASLLHRSGISHDWEECIYNLEKIRSKKRSESIKSDSKDDDNNIIPKSWAMDLTRSYSDLKEEYQLRKESLQLHGFEEEEDDEDDDDWDEAMPFGTPHLEEYYNADQDPKFVLFRHLLREWFAGGADSTKEDIDNSWPRQWSPDEEGYYENGRIKQVPLMRFPSQILNCDGLSIRSLIQREFRAPTVEEKYERECNSQAKSTSSSAVGSNANAQSDFYPPSSYIDNPIRLQTALYALQELNRKLSWAAKIGIPSPNDWAATQHTREWKRLIQAAKGVSSFPETEKDPASDDELPLSMTHSTTNDDDNTTPSDQSSPIKDAKKPTQPLDCGTLLIAHPLMTGYFANTVIILLDHTAAPKKDKSDSKSAIDNDESKNSGGTYGLIVNRYALEANSAETTLSRLELLRQQFEEKKERDLAEMLLQSSDSEKKELDDDSQKADNATRSTRSSAKKPISLLQAVKNDDLPDSVQRAFGDSPIRDGGPVNLSIQMIHRKAVPNDVEAGSGSTKDKSKVGGTLIPSHFGMQTVSPNEVEETYFGGDVIKASFAVLQGLSDADDFSFIIGASCWSPGQLENEIQRGCWLRFCGPSSMAMTGMCDHFDKEELDRLYSDQNEDEEAASEGTKLSAFPPRPSNAGKLSVAGSATRGSNNTQKSSERPLGDLWLSIMCALSQGEADLASVMLNSNHVKDDLGDACDNFYR